MIRPTNTLELTTDLRASKMRRPFICLLVAIIASLAFPQARAQDEDVVPRGQSKVPNPPRSATEAASKMTVPNGFKVEVVASEPDLVNPVAMTFDERGRAWVTESLEYPRNEPGIGRDRIKILEDTDGDGKADKFTIFAEGLNIPSGIAVGHGGVWVANSPDLLFFKDTDGDGKADSKEVVVTGFGRYDTHELPNSLTWGPDGWLYGWNGVFNQSIVKYRGKTYDFTCAIFRVHPKTREFELFCEGTSNPWGITHNLEGETFASACVIDHIWHLTESGYYHRQGGPYPPHTWKIESIADHQHQQAAYCGIHFFDSDAYPEIYREKLYLGNVHAGSINVDVLKRNGSTYVGSTAPDFLNANDAWFMPVSQKTGPDGSLYILDWYDRYHCYQDAQRDPQGVDRLKGRLYRVRYENTPRAPKFNLAQETDEALIERLSSPNIYFRDTAQRILSERATPSSRQALQALFGNAKSSLKARHHALWALIGGGPLDPGFHQTLLVDKHPSFRAWGVRAAGNQHKVATDLIQTIVAMANDPVADVRLQVAIAARKIEGIAPLPVLVSVLQNSNGDVLIPKIVWRNLEPLLEDKTNAAKLVDVLTVKNFKASPALTELTPRIVNRLLSRANPLEVPLGKIVSQLIQADAPETMRSAADILNNLCDVIQSGQIQGPTLASLKAQFEPIYLPILKNGQPDELRGAVALLATSCENPQAITIAKATLADAGNGQTERLDALLALVSVNEPGTLDAVDRILSKPESKSESFRAQVLAALTRLDHDRVASIVLKNYDAMESDLKPKAVELLTQRPQWAVLLLKAIAKKEIDRNSLNVNQLRNLQSSKNEQLTDLLKVEYGTIRTGRNGGRETVIGQVRDFLAKTPGDAKLGTDVFKRVCAQCHKIYGAGEDVGPEITRNGRGSYDQLLSNVFDPSLVIGAAFQGTTVATNDGRVLSGLIVEDSPQKIVLKLQGGKLETIARGDVDAVKKSELSLMPEDVEKQLSPKEIADLFAYITLDRPPSDPKAEPIPGAQELPKVK